MAILVTLRPPRGRVGRRLRAGEYVVACHDPNAHRSDGACILLRRVREGEAEAVIALESAHHVLAAIDPEANAAWEKFHGPLYEAIRRFLPRPPR